MAVRNRDRQTYRQIYGDTDKLLNQRIERDNKQRKGNGRGVRGRQRRKETDRQTEMKT